MKSRFNLIEAGIILIIFGTSMVVFPSIFENSTTYTQTAEDGLIMGIYLISTGLVLLFIKFILIRKKIKL